MYKLHKSIVMTQLEQNFLDAAMHDNCWYDDEQMIEDFQKAMEE